MSSRWVRGPLVYSSTTVQTAAGNVTVANESMVIVDKTSSQATTVTLPGGNVLTGQTVIVKDGKGDAASYPITVVPDGVTATTIDGAASHVINTAYGSVAFTFDGGQWGATAVPGATGAGAKNGTGVTASEGVGAVHKTVLTFADVAVALTDNAGTVAYGGLKVYDFPAGNILILGAVADIDLTKSSAGVNDDWDGDFGVGSETASNNNTLSSTEQNIIPTTSTPQADSGATTADGVSTAVAILDGTATAADAYINFLVDDADHDVTSTPCNLIVNGTLTLHWINLGDK